MTEAERRKLLRQQLRYHSVSLNAPDKPMQLFADAINEIERLDGLLKSPICSGCQKEVTRDDDWYRCFDCKANLCGSCIYPSHFGTQHKPHRPIEQMEQQIEMLQFRLDQKRPSF